MKAFSALTFSRMTVRITVKHRTQHIDTKCRVLLCRVSAMLNVAFLMVMMSVNILKVVMLRVGGLYREAPKVMDGKCLIIDLSYLAMSKVTLKQY